MGDHAHAHEGAHWHSEPQALMVGFGAGFFLPWAFMLQYVYDQGLFAIIVLTLALLLMVAGGVGWVGHTVGVIKDEGWSPSAMMMFIFTEVMTIAGLLVAYYTTRLQAPVWPPEGTPHIAPPYFMTFFLIVSSFTIALARKKQLEGNASGFANLTIISLLIWVIFGTTTIMSWMDLTAQGFVISSNAFATAMYGMGGIHLAHIIFGLCIMLLALPPAFKGRLSHSYARAMNMYVHFVNILGIWVLLQIYVW